MPEVVELAAELLWLRGLATIVKWSHFAPESLQRRSSGAPH